MFTSRLSEISVMALVLGAFRYKIFGKKSSWERSRYWLKNSKFLLQKSARSFAMELLEMRSGENRLHWLLSQLILVTRFLNVAFCWCSTIPPFQGPSHDGGGQNAVSLWRAAAQVSWCEFPFTWAVASHPPESQTAIKANMNSIHRACVWRIATKWLRESETVSLNSTAPRAGMRRDSRSLAEVESERAA